MPNMAITLKRQEGKDDTLWRSSVSCCLQFPSHYDQKNQGALWPEDERIPNFGR